MLHSGFSELYSLGALERAAEKASFVLHDKAIRKAISIDKPLKKLAELHQFSQMACGGQSAKYLGLQSARPSSGKGSLFSALSGLNSLSFTGRCRRGKKFWWFLASLSAAGGCSRVAMKFLEFLLDRGLDGGSPPLQAYHFLPPLPTCVTRTSLVPFLQLRVCQGSSTSRRSGRDAVEGCLGTDESSGPGYYSWLFVVQTVTGDGIPRLICWIWTGTSLSPSSTSRQFHRYWVQSGRETSFSQLTSRTPTSRFSFTWGLNLIPGKIYFGALPPKWGGSSMVYHFFRSPLLGQKLVCSSSQRLQESIHIFYGSKAKIYQSHYLSMLFQNFKKLHSPCKVHSSEWDFPLILYSQAYANLRMNHQIKH